ncbi:MAG TPA: prepilin-type N-terminal cleavage/methylation domain-containing protein [candidate division WWE3 bacterium]|uniref:Prepilin-type N-terminal cleavage/methylation domain-containing protein n=1 Tax=candidate division WWE3 bacterium TaxID=2053526 RepID=A0A7C1HDD9_UNCKA|nr:prepilin-type N-terminal cleavage/methylation domain-containing protein [candidate division WWE3 bacterium]
MLTLFGKTKKKKNQGITLMELILTIALIGILSAITFPMGAKFNQKNQVKNTRDALKGYLNTARSFAQSGKNGSSWGVQITSNEIVLYNGENYANRNTAFDQQFTIPKGNSVTIAEINFSKDSGNTSERAITVINPSEVIQYTITVDASGNIYEL